MRIGIIDFGTNTIRLDIFEVDGDNYSIIFDNAIFSHIIENTVGNSLSQDGIEYVIQAIEEQQAACRHYRCDKIECFSTASLRYIENADSVVEQVAFRSGINIKRISGDEEAAYDYRALKRASGCKSGVGCDLGGGSLKVFTFDENGPTKSKSFPLGSSRMAKEYVSGEIPTAEEAAEIMRRVKSELAGAGFAPVGGRLLAMGGTAKAVNRLYRFTTKNSGALSTETLSAMLGVICEQPEEAYDLLSDIVPKRAHTLAPGLAVLTALTEYMNCSEMDVYPVGVREGFLEALLEQPPQEPDDIISYILGLSK